jgi:hypothetical protein
MGDYLFLVPDVVPRGEDVHTVVQQFVSRVQREAEASGGIFSVGYDQIYGVLPS